MAFPTQPKSEQTIAVEQALELLLTKHQVAYIESRTFAGPDKRTVLRRLVTQGIADDVMQRRLMGER